jgi:hypothetical protein
MVGWLAAMTWADAVIVHTDGIGPNFLMMRCRLEDD